MIEVLQQPENIALSNNQLVCKFRAITDFGKPYGPVGAKATIGVGATGFPAASTLILTWTDTNGAQSIVTFTAVASPSSDNEIQSAATAQPFSYFEAIAAKIQNHPHIAPYFILSAGDDDPTYLITAQSIDTNESITIAWTSTDVTVGSNSATPAEPDDTPGNYKLEVDVYQEGVHLGIVQGDPDKDGIIAFDISEILHKSMIEGRAYPPIPVFGNTLPLLSNTTKQYHLRYRETFDDSDEGFQYLDTKKLLYGGIKKNLFADYDFFTSLTETNSILTWYPNGKDVSLDQPEYISWYNYLPTTEKIMLSVRLINEEGDATTFFKFLEDPIDVLPGHVINIPVGYNQLGIGDEDFETVKYTVQVCQHQAAPAIPIIYYSQLRSYYVDDNYYHDKRYIMYLNGFGVPQTVRCLGELDTGLTITRQTSEKILPIDYKSLESETIQVDAEYKTPFTFRTGYLSKWEIESLQELLIYNDAYLITERGFTPIHLTEKKFNLGGSRDSLHSLTFKAVPRFTDKNYSNINFPFEAAQTGWATDPNTFWWDDNSQNWSI